MARVNLFVKEALPVLPKFWPLPSSGIVIYSFIFYDDGGPRFDGKSASSLNNRVFD
jgi:hypothetical protein